MEVRLMTIEDYQAVYALWLSCKGMGLNNLDDSKEGIAKFLKRNPTTCLVAQEADVTIGVILAGHDGRRGYIYHTAVHPRFRKLGIAKSLVSEALQAFEDEGIHKVALLVFNKNQAGNAFWGKVGFEERQDVTYRNKAISFLIRLDT